MFRNNLDLAAQQLEARAEVKSVNVLRSLSMIIVNTNDMHTTATAGSKLPGFMIVEEHQLLLPNTMESEYDLSPVDYYGTEWYNHPQGHLMRQNITALHDMGLTGAGVTIAVIDRGFHPNHPVYEDRIAGYYRSIYNPDIYDTEIIPVAPPTTCNVNTHGLLVASVAAGRPATNQNHNTGVAPSADLLLFDMLDVYEDGTCIQSGLNLLQVADFLINEGNLRAQIVNASWGSDAETSNYNPAALDDIAISTMRAHGIIFVAAAGNNVEAQRVSHPALHPEVLAVGAISPNPLSPLNFEYTNDGLNLLSTQGMGGYPSDWDDARGEITYGAVVAGTSVAAPQVAGVIALLLEHIPNLTPDEIQEALERTAHNALDDGTNSKSVGHGVIDALAALEYLDDPGRLPNHKISLLIDGVEMQATVRPDGTFVTPYLPNGQHVITATTNLMAHVDLSHNAIVTLQSNTDPSSQPPLEFHLSN